LNFLVYDRAVKIRKASSPKLQNIKIEDGNLQTEKLFQKIISGRASTVYNGVKQTKFLSMKQISDVWKMEFTFITPSDNL
jgi:hypothetical protein